MVGRVGPLAGRVARHASRSLRSRTCRARSDGTRRRTSRTLSERQGATHESDGSTSRIRSLRGGVWCRTLSGRHVEPRLKGWSLLSSSVGATSRLVTTTLKLESVRVASRLDAPGTGSCLAETPYPSRPFTSKASRPADPSNFPPPLSRPGRDLAKPAQSRCHSFGRLLRLLAVRRARAANSRTSFRTLDHVAALPRLLSNDEAEALADCTACRSCLVSVLCMSSEWWRCVCGVLGTGSSRSPRGSGVRLAPESRAECHRVATEEVSGSGNGGSRGGTRQTQIDRCDRPCRVHPVVWPS